MAEFNAKQGVQAPYIVVANTLGAAGGMIKFTAPAEETITMTKKDSTVTFRTPEVPPKVTKLPLSMTGMVNARSLCHVNGTLVVAGTSYLGYSSDLKSINRINSAPFNAGSFSPNVVSNPTKTLWVVGADNAVYTSDDGLTWVSRTVTQGRRYYECAFFRGRLWVTCTGGVIRSDNYGSSWNDVSITGNSSILMSVYANNDMIVVGGENGELHTSTDGSTWTKRNFPAFYTGISKITFHKGVYHLQTQDTEIFTTTDFVNFESARSFGTTSGSMVTTDSFLCVAGGQTAQVSVSAGNNSWFYIPLPQIQSEGGYVNAATVLDDSNILVLSAMSVVYQVTLGSVSNILFEMNKQGVTIGNPQLDKPNALVRKDYVDAGLAKAQAANPDIILAETDKRYFKITGGTVTGNTQFNSKVVIDSASPNIEFKVSNVTKYIVGVSGNDYTFSTDAPPSIYSAVSQIPGSTDVVWDAGIYKDAIYVGGNAYVKKSINGGASWTDVSLPVPASSGAWLFVGEVDGSLMILGRDNSGPGARLYSPDGVTWTRLANPAGSRNYDNPIFATKLKMGKYMITGLGFVSISDTINGTYKRFEWHGNTPAVTKYCYTVSEHGDRIVAHVQDSTTAVAKAYVSNDRGVSFAIASYTGDIPAGQIYGSGIINGTWYYVDQLGSLYTSADGINMTKVIASPAASGLNFGAVEFSADGKIIVGDSSGVVRFTSDLTTWSTFKTGMPVIRAIIPNSAEADSHYVFSATSSVGKVKLQYSGAPFGITPVGPITNRPQQDIPNSLVRRDYVDKLVSAVETKMESRNYLPLAGGTLTGTLNLNVPNSSGFGQYSIAMNDGSIGAVNAIIFNDASDVTEGLFFPKSGRAENTTSPADYDNIRALDGHLLLNGQKTYGEWNKPTPNDIGILMDTVSYGRTSSGDLDKDILPGHYHINNSATNRPVTDLLFGHMTVSSIGKTGQGNWFQQTFYGHAAPFRIWTRRNVNGTFSPWKRIYTEDDPITAAELGINASGLNPDLYYTKNQVYSQDQVNTQFAQFNAKYDANNDGVVDKANVANMVVGAAETGYPSYYGKNMNGVVGFHAFTPRVVDDTLNQQYNIPNAKANIPVKITLESPAPLQNTIIQCYKLMPGIQNITEVLETFNTNNSVKYYIESDNLAFTDTGAAIKSLHEFVTSAGPTNGTFISEEITPSTFQTITGIV